MVKRRSRRSGSGEGEGWLASAAAVSLDFLLVTAAAAVAVYVLVRLRIVILPVIAALFIAVLIYPPVKWLKSHRWPPLGATWLVILLAFSLVTGLVMIISTPIQEQLGDVAGSFEEGMDRVVSWLGEGRFGISEEQMQTYQVRIEEELRQHGPQIVGGLAAGAIRAVEIIAQTLLALVLAFFFVKDGPRMVEWTLQRMPSEGRDKLREGLQRSWSTLSSYLWGITLIAAVDAVLVAMVLLVLGVPLVVPLSTLVFVGAFFPYIGAIVAGLVATLVALVNSGPLDALLVAGAFLVIQQVEGDVLQPVIMSRAVSLHPVVIIAAITAGAGLYGVVGAFLAVPAVAVLVTTGSYLRQVKQGTAEGNPDPVADT